MKLFERKEILASNVLVDLGKPIKWTLPNIRLIGITRLYAHPLYAHESLENAARLQTVESKQRPLSIKFHESWTRGGFRGRR